MNYRMTTAAALSLLLLLGSAKPKPAAKPLPPIDAPPFTGTLSVLTYNVHGVPWPIATGRAAAFERIGATLRAMHEAGSAPQIVALQESFTGQARAIAARAGYRYVVDGPGVGERNGGAMTVGDRAFAVGGRWWKGERSGKWLGSGLQILSDYPVVGVARVAFPDFACAGYDCLANKGALLVSLRVPGAAMPIDVVTTHLNSRHSSYVPDARSIVAYRRQVGVLTRFIRSRHDPARPLIAAGDFNVGIALPRCEALLAAVQHGWGLRGPVRDALRHVQRQEGALSADAAFSLRRGRDWQFYASGARDSLRADGISVPFGRDRDGAMLSDHVGYVARFDLRPATKV